jgi:hypothetical protein
MTIRAVAYADTEQTRVMQARIAELESALAAALAMTDAEKKALQTHCREFPRLAIHITELEARIKRLRTLIGWRAGWGGEVDAQEEAAYAEQRANDWAEKGHPNLANEYRHEAAAWRDVAEHGDLEEEPDGAQTNTDR